MVRQIDLRELPEAEFGYVCKGEGKFPRMVQFSDGTLFVTTHRGTHKPGPNNAQYGFRSADGGRTWEGPFALCDRPGIDPRSPAIGVAPDGTLCAGWKELPFERQDESEVVFQRSPDRGEHWELVGVVAMPEKNRLGHTYGKLLFEDDGAILMHVYTFPSPGATGCKRAMDSRLFESADHGATWQRRGLIAERANETAIIRRRDGALLAAARTDERDPRLIALTSSDDGRTWTAHGPITGPREIPAELLRLSNGWLVCFYGQRNPPYGVCAKVSFDDGETWADDFDLLVEDSWPTRDCGYPTAELLSNGAVVVAWYVNSDGPASLREERQCRRLRFPEKALIDAIA